MLSSLLLFRVPALLGFSAGTVVASVLATLAVLAAGLVVLAYRQPHQRGLYLAQLVALGLCLALRVQLALEPADALGEGLQAARELLQAALALGVWLNAVRWVRRTHRVAGQRALLALAVVALESVLLLGPALALAQYSRAHPGTAGTWQAAYTLLGLADVLVAWWLVSRQLRGQLPLAAWRPWWLPPLLVAAIGTATLLAGVWFTFSQNRLILTPGLLLQIGAQNLVIGWAWSALALLVVRPARWAVGYGERPAA